LEFEDIDHLFDTGGITGGVFTSKGGRTVEPHFHAMENVDSEDLEKSGIGANETLAGEERVEFSEK